MNIVGIDSLTEVLHQFVLWHRKPWCNGSVNA